jgi:hypothetical protein
MLTTDERMQGWSVLLVVVLLMPHHPIMIGWKTEKLRLIFRIFEDFIVMPRVEPPFRI